MGMRMVVFAVMALMLSAQSRAQVKGKTLYCQSTRAQDLLKQKYHSASSSFSATLLMHVATVGDEKDEIITTTADCSTYHGAFTKVQVTGKCKETLTRNPRWDEVSVLTIDRVSGNFSRSMFLWMNGQLKSKLMFKGHCIPTKKMF